MEKTTQERPRGGIAIKVLNKDDNIHKRGSEISKRNCINHRIA